MKYVESEGVQFDPTKEITPEMFAEALPQIMDLSKPVEHGFGTPRLEARLRAMGLIK